MNINKYKFFARALNLAIRAKFLMIVAIALLLPLAVRAEVSNPNGIKNKPEPGWSLWRT